MSRMPGATWRPLPLSPPDMRAHDIICIHTMVGSLDGTDGYFRRSGISSHFGTGGDGRIYQWLDTRDQSGANYLGNYRCISIENADMGPEFAPWNTNDGSAVPAFTAKQVEAIAKILAWASQAHNIPLVLVPDSKPGRRGVAYHRQGVIGYMVPGGEQWSKSAGKVCPANRRIAQIPGIIARAIQIKGGAPAPAPEEDDDMAVFIADERGAWWLYDGFTRRYVRPGEPQVLKDLGLVKSATEVKRISAAFFNAIPRSDVDLIDEAEIARLVSESLKAGTAPA